MKRFGQIVFAVAFLLSVGFNIFMVNYISSMNSSSNNFLVYKNANSRDNYFTMHNVAAAHTLTKGSGIKVGIIDTSFAYKKHANLYAGGANFTDNAASFNDSEHHGYWMATTLREIAPEAEIYALGIPFADEGEKVAALVEAIDWAIENNLDVLTYSSARFSEEYRSIVDAAVDKAYEHGIMTTFIHYPYEKNLFPNAFDPYFDTSMREPDLNIYPYDYNVIMIRSQREYVNASTDEQLGMMRPFTSASSTSPVTAGFVALLKSINDTLSPEEYRNILVTTSREIVYEGYAISRVPDIYGAVKLILSHS